MQKKSRIIFFRARENGIAEDFGFNKKFSIITGASRWGKATAKWECLEQSREEYKKLGLENHIDALTKFNNISIKESNSSFSLPIHRFLYQNFHLLQLFPRKQLAARF